MCAAITLEQLQLDIDDAALRLVRLAEERGVTLSCAESLTAGMVSSSIAAVPGASAVLLGGAVTYTNQVKERLLSVSEKTIQEVTEVSYEVAQQMASGACSLFGSDYAVSLTGYAGPGGGTDSNPVGTVYIGLCSPQVVFSKRFVFAGDRQEVRFQACLEALRMLFDALGR